jgi:hypothetical protein
MKTIEMVKYSTDNLLVRKEIMREENKRDFNIYIYIHTLHYYFIKLNNCNRNKRLKLCPQKYYINL